MRLVLYNCHKAGSTATKPVSPPDFLVRRVVRHQANSQKKKKKMLDKPFCRVTGYLAQQRRLESLPRDEYSDDTTSPGKWLPRVKSVIRAEGFLDVIDCHVSVIMT